MKTQEGFTLIEVLISMLVLAFGLLAVASMQVVAIQVNSSGDRLTQGATLVQDKIEELLGLPFNNPSLADATPVGACQSYNEPGTPQGYTMDWCVDADATGTSKTVNVTATWSNRGQQKSFSLSLVRTIFQ
jgi:type IV pilus assembly protein PilV